MAEELTERTYKYQVPAEVFVEAFTTAEWSKEQEMRFNKIGIERITGYELKKRNLSLNRQYYNTNDIYTLLTRCKVVGDVTITKIKCILPHFIFYQSKLPAITIIDCQWAELNKEMKKIERGTKFYVTDSIMDNFNIKNSITGNFNINKSCTTGNFRIENSTISNFRIGKNSRIGDFWLTNSIINNFNIEKSTTGYFEITNTSTGDFWIHENSMTGGFWFTDSITSNFNIEKSTTGYFEITNTSTGDFWIRKNSMTGGFGLTNSITRNFNIVKSTTDYFQITNSTTEDFRIHEDSTIRAFKINTNSTIRNISIVNSTIGNCWTENSTIGDFWIANSTTGNFWTENSTTGDFRIRENSTTGYFWIENSTTGNFRILENSTTSYFRIRKNSTTGSFWIPENSTTGDFRIENSSSSQWDINAVYASFSFSKATIGQCKLNNCYISELRIENECGIELYVSGGTINKIDFSQLTLGKNTVVSLSGIAVYSCMMFEFAMLGNLYVRAIKKNTTTFEWLDIKHYIGKMPAGILNNKEITKYNKKKKLLEEQKENYLKRCQRLTQEIPQATFRISQSSLGKTEFTECDLSGFSFEYSNSKINEVFISGGTVPEGGIVILGEEEGTKGWFQQKVSIYTQLKKIFAAQGDVYYESVFHAQTSHHQLYLLKHLRREKKYKKIKWVFSEETFDILTYRLNQFSNKHSASWGRSLGFILVASTMLYTLYIVANGLLGFGSSAKWDLDLIGYYFSFLDPTHKIDFMKDAGGEINFGTMAFDFIGRILIGYGIYQLISAFRKHGKKV